MGAFPFMTQIRILASFVAPDRGDPNTDALDLDAKHKGELA
jgi:hypothetical protein